MKLMIYMVIIGELYLRVRPVVPASGERKVEEWRLTRFSRKPSSAPTYPAYEQLMQAIEFHLDK